MIHKLGFALVSGVVAALLLNVPGATAQAESGSRPRQRVLRAVDETNRIALTGNVRPEATPANDHGRVADALPMEHMLLQLKRSPGQEKALRQFIDELHNASSPNFHHWLTAQEFGERFGLAQSDLDAISAWLQSHGFQVNVVYPSGMLIDFSGTASQVRKAFETEIHNIDVKGERHIANMSDPRIPAALSSVISGVVSLHDFRPRAMHHLRKAKSEFTFTDIFGGTNYALVPADLATIYNLNPLFTSGISGQGQTIALIEDTDVFSAADWSTFRSTFGLDRYTSASFTQVHPPAPPSQPSNNCAAPGIISPNDGEAILDAEWASASAPSAAIVMAACADTSTTFGGLIAIQNLINADTPPPSIMSISYGQCETVNGAAANASYNSAYQQAVTEGVSIFVAAGDSGAAGCDNGAAQATHGIGANAFASTPYNVAVGGTDFSDTFDGTNANYWNAGNAAAFGSALSYIPEVPWNDSCAGELFSSYLGYPTYGPNSLCNDPFIGFLVLSTVAGGGGPSQCATGTPSTAGVVSGSCAGWPKPSWQSVLGNPSDGVRDTPDVSLFAADGLWSHFYVFCWSDTAHGGAACGADPSAWSGAGGTSFASPILAGIQALINQKAGGSQGNPAPVYYQLAAAEYGATGSTSCNSSNGTGVAANCIFYDVTRGDIDVDCVGPNCYLGGGSVGVLSTSNTALSPAFGTTMGWDFATGIGTVNATNLVNNWPVSAASATTLVVGAASGTVGGTADFSATLAAGATGVSGKSISFKLNGNNVGSALSDGSGNATVAAVSLAGISAGTYPGAVTAAFAGDSGFSASSGSSTLTVQKLDQTITFGALANKTFGNPDFSVSATASSTLTVTFAASGNCTVAGSTVHISGVGSCTITASQAGNGTYNPAANVQQSFSIQAPPALPTSGWRLLYVDSEATDCGNYGATNAFDGNPATMWHTGYCHGSPPPPHDIQIDLGASYTISGLQYLPRQDSSTNGNVAAYELYVSSDGVNWGTAVSSGTLMTSGSDKTQKQVTFTGVVGRYVRFRALSEVHGSPWTAAAELNVLGTQVATSSPQVASVTLNPASIAGGGIAGSGTVTLTSAPSSSATVTLASSNTSAATVPATVIVNAGTTSANFTVTSASSVSTPTLSVINASYNGSTGAAVLTVTPGPGSISASPIPQAGWRLMYVDSQATDCGNYGATNAFDGNPATMWHTEWCHGNPPPPHEMQIDLGASYTISGFQYLPRQDGGSNGNVANYELYVSTDGVNWGTAVSSGTLIATPSDMTQKQVTFTSVFGRYLRFRARSEVHGGPWTAAAEINVLGH